MATQRQLKTRWEDSPGKEIQARIYALGIIEKDHGHRADELFQLLDGLPFRDEIANGRDLRGLNISAGELDLSCCNFAYSQMGSFFHCNLNNSVFDGCTAERASFHSSVSKCSFVRAKLRSCYFNDSIVTDCDFSKARLAACSFQDADLRGSRFCDAHCRRATFAGANLIGCDFSGANLEGAVFCDVVLDKSTNFRGANLSNAITTDWYDNQGNLRRKGADLSQATL